MTRPDRRVSVYVAAVALVIAIAALVVALTRSPSRPSVAATPGTTTTITSAAPSVPRAGTLSRDGTGRPTLQLVGYVRIPISHTGTYTWTSHLLSAPSSVMSVGGQPDVGGDSHRVDGTAVVTDFRSSWVGNFPKGNLIGERVTFRVMSYRGKPFVELFGSTISGAVPTTTATTAP